MSQYVETACKSFPAGGAVAIHLRVKTPTALAAAGATDIDIGTIEQAALASGDECAVRLRSAQGTCKMVASGAITAGANIYGAASGKVSATINTNPIGVALETVTADGDVVEVMRTPLPQIAFPAGEDHAAGDTLTVAESGTLHTNVGASGAIVLVLPAATVGLHYRFYVVAVQELRIDPDGTETIALPSTGVQGAAGKYLTANAAGEWVHLFCMTAGEWEAVAYGGIWTAEG